MPAPASTADMHCPQCGYALQGLPTRTCPECGTTFDAEILQWRLRHLKRRRWLLSALLMALAMYAPFSWLLFMDYPWNGYRWLWLKMWPILPGLPATILLRIVTNTRVPDWAEMASMGLISALALLLFAWLGARGRRWLIITAGIVLALSCYNGWVGYMMFRL